MRNKVVGRGLRWIVLVLSLAGCKPYEETPVCPQLEGIFSLQRDVVFFFAHGDDWYSVGVPGTGSDLPVSIKSYQEHPDDWMHRDPYLDSHPNAHLHHQEKILGVLPKGTQFHVVEMRIVRDEWGPLPVPMAQTDDPQLKGELIDIGGLCLPDREDDLCMRPDPRYLKRL